MLRNYGEYLVDKEALTLRKRISLEMKAITAISNSFYVVMYYLFVLAPCLSRATTDEVK